MPRSRQTEHQKWIENFERLAHWEETEYRHRVNQRSRINAGRSDPRQKRLSQISVLLIVVVTLPLVAIEVIQSIGWIGAIACAVCRSIRYGAE